MNRRDFIKLLALSGLAVGCLPVITRKGYAAGAGGTNQFLVTIGADGGWDTTSLFDPKGQAKGVNNVDLDDTLVTPNGIRWSAVPGSVGSDIQARVADQYQKFFTTYDDQLTIIRGLNAMTVSHSVGSRLKLSGSAGNYPSLSALYGAAYGSGLPLAYLTFGSAYGGADYTAELDVTKALLGDGSLIDQMADPALGQDDAVYQMIIQKHLARLERQIMKENSAGGFPLYAKKMEQLLAERLQVNMFLPLQQNLNSLNSGNGFNPDWYSDRAASLKLQARITAASFATGTSCCASLTWPGFDTHYNNDRQFSQMGDLVEGIHTLMEALKFFGIEEQTTVVVASDIGRAGKYNADGGKDHGTTTGMMVLHPKSSGLGGRVFGETSDSYGEQPINFVTGKHDSNGTRLNVLHMMAALREHLGLMGTDVVSDFDLGDVPIPSVFS
ncbi:DUF1501 domain-containing protein [Gynuella sp.]|uniref:DUF1501 domain-containing protein n=1 Tax=Gynuella sp. TaxID=2969146 RepID=UPI003D0F2213